MAVKILTVHEPWAWSFFDFAAECKDVENRSRATKHRGPLAIHVSRKQLKAVELDEIDAFIARAVGGSLPDYMIPRTVAFRGHIIGVVNVIDCVRDSRSRWAMPGYWHWVVANPRRVRPVPIVGQQGMFERDVELEYL